MFRWSQRICFYEQIPSVNRDSKFSKQIAGELKELDVAVFNVVYGTLISQRSVSRLISVCYPISHILRT